ncbi:MAG: recombinase family protein [Anaerovoracaceae bacterium]
MGKQTFYGYMRVSSADQNHQRQEIQLEKWGIVAKNIYADKLSGKNFNRPEYQKLRRKLRRGDVLVVKSIDRLGRDYVEIQKEWSYLVKTKGADIVILDMPILDTRTNKDLIGTLISDIVLQLLSYVAQAERENIHQRQAEGIAAAKARGVHMGRASNPLPDGFYHYYDLWKDGILTVAQSAKKLNITENQFRWLIRKERAKTK